jgi:hypothetical protein
VELRHLRYFIAVAEEGSLTFAAEKRLHTAQPSLSRQIRDLEYEVGVQLMSRSVHGIELTAAGKSFLDHARLALAQVNAAVEAARRVGQPKRKTFAIPRRDLPDKWQYVEQLGPYRSLSEDLNQKTKRLFVCWKRGTLIVEA